MRGLDRRCRCGTGRGNRYRPLFGAVASMLKPGGIFVFSIHPPCFVKPEGTCLTPQVHEGEAIRGQPVKQLYYHRPLQEIFRACFDAGFVVDGFSRGTG